MKRLTILSLSIFLSLFIIWQGEGLAYTFEDDFSNPSWTANNWSTIQYNWYFDLEPDVYHGSAGPPWEPPHLYAGERPPAITAANNGISFYNDGLEIEAVFRINSDDSDRRMGGIFFAMDEVTWEEFPPYSVELVYNVFDPILGFDLMFHDRPQDQFPWIDLDGPIPTNGNPDDDVYFDTFYMLKVLVSDTLSIYLYDETGVDLKGSMVNLPLSLQTNNGKVGILTGSEVTFKSFSVTGNPVPIPTTILLLGSGLVGLAGFRRNKIKK